MRVALVSSYDLAAPGGVQSHVCQLALALRSLGDEVTVIGPCTGETRWETPPVGVGRSLRVPFNDSVAPVALAPTTIRRTRRALARARPDVIHVHEPIVPWAGLTAALSTTAPVVATFHAWSDRDRIYRLARPLAGLLDRRLAASVAVSEAAAGYHARALGWPERRFTIVPNGVDVAHFASAEPLPEVAGENAPTILYVGRLEPRKGLEVLVRAFTRLKADLPEVRLHVVGEGGERQRCTALLSERLRADVEFHGRAHGDEVPRWFASCDLYVSPALGGESFGIVLLEAMAAGRAFVASDIPGYRGVASDGVQGRLVPPGDPVALAEAMHALLDNPALRAAMGREGRRTVEAYDWGVVAGRLRALYQEVLA